MRRLLTLIFITVGLIPLAAQTQPTSNPLGNAAQQTEATPPTHIVVISIDGARPDGIEQATTPNLDELGASGVLAPVGQAQTIFPSVTLPAHVSLLTGLDIRDHDVRHNDFRDQKIEQPTFINVAAAGGYDAGLVVGKNKLWQLWYPEAELRYAFAEAGDRSVVDEAITMLDDGAEVLFVHLPNIDFFGHSTEWMSDTYIFELRNTDAQIGRLLDWYADAGVLETTLVIVTADHGGHGTSHGTALPEDMNVPLYIAGPNIAPDSLIEGEVSIMNVAATVIAALGLAVPEAMAEPLVIQAP